MQGLGIALYKGKHCFKEDIQTEDYCTLISSIASNSIERCCEKWQIFEEFQAWVVMTSVAALYHAPVGFLAGNYSVRCICVVFVQLAPHVLLI